MEVPWVIQEHTKVKHELLKQYISPWMNILFRTQKKFRYPQVLIYIDGFSGPGIYYTDEKRDSLCNGSPLIVAEIANTYIEQDKSRKILMYCIDIEKKCTDILKERLKKSNQYDQKWEVYEADFERKIFEIISDIEGKKLVGAPMFIFIDPIGYSGYQIGILKDLLSNPRTELFINFMIYDIVRFCETKQFESLLTKQFGDEEYKKIDTTSNPETKQLYLKNLYCQNLRKYANAEYVMPFRVNTPDQGQRPRYYLIHVSKNIKALKVMKNSMSKISQADYSFEAIGINTLQMSLFNDPEKISIEEKLKEYCRSAFPKPLEYTHIEDWAYVNTNGVAKTIKDSLKILEEKGIIEIRRKKGQRANTVTDGALIRFSKDYIHE
ncbi:MAG: three-Cys-motif partner protein TcmP [Spirochaetes bacterium]|nr:three-Cys-motif partner protein TcmP [Spirochaetota bacterium]